MAIRQPARFHDKDESSDQSVSTTRVDKCKGAGAPIAICVHHNRWFASLSAGPSMATCLARASRSGSASLIDPSELGTMFGSKRQSASAVDPPGQLGTGSLQHNQGGTVGTAR